MDTAREPDLVDVIVRITDRELADQFLTDILTPTERREFESRWELVKLLDKGVPQRQIARELGLSLCKITRGSRELKSGTGSLKRLLSS